MSQTDNFFRKYSDMVAEAEQVNEGSYRSDVAVKPGDANRVQVAPNVQNKIVQYDKDKASAEKARTQQAMDQHPVWSGVGKTVGDVVGGAQARWSALKGATSNAIDQQTGADRHPDPAKPVDIIPDPRRGTATPRESAGDLMRKFADQLNETEFKGVTNQMDKSSEFMKVYKQVNESKQYKK